MKIAVTGASGFIGSYVLQELSRRKDIEIVAASRTPLSLGDFPPGIHNVCLDMSTAQTGAFDSLGRPDLLIHLAWAGLPHYRSLHHFETELPRQYAFIRALIDAGLRSLFVTGTCYEYGMRCGELHESLAAQPANAYAYAKNALREQLQYLCSQIHFDFTWARLFYMYGRGQASTSLYSQLMAAIERKDPVFEMSRGEQLRDYLPVEEVARLIVELAVRRQGTDVVNICSGKPISVRGLVEQLVAERGCDIELDLGKYPYPDYEPMAFWGCGDKLRSLLGNNTFSA